MYACTRVSCRNWWIGEPDISPSQCWWRVVLWFTLVLECGRTPSPSSLVAPNTQATSTASAWLFGKKNRPDDQKTISGMMILAVLLRQIYSSSASRKLKSNMPDRFLSLWACTGGRQGTLKFSNDISEHICKSQIVYLSMFISFADFCTFATQSDSLSRWGWCHFSLCWFEGSKGGHWVKR